MEYLCHNESVLSSFLEHQVDVYRNNDVEWNYRYIKVFFAALEYPASPKMIHKLFSALPNYKDIIMDLIELYQNNRNSLQGVSLKNNVFYKYVINKK